MMNVSSSSIPKSYPDLRRRYRGNKALIIHPETSSWAILDAYEVSILNSINGSYSIFDISQEQSLSLPLVEDTVIKLYKLGMVSLGSYSPLATLEHRSANRYPSLAVLHVSDYCNLRCSYCYTCFSKSKLKMMKLQTMLQVIDQMLDLPNDIIGIEYHGGEPTARIKPIAKSMEYANNAASRAGKTLHLMIQSNGTMVNDYIIDVLKLNNVKVRISIDGPPSIHDQFRVFSDGSATSSNVESGIKYLLRADIDTEAVVVVTIANVFQMPLITKYLLDLGINKIRFLPIFISGHAQKHLHVSADLFHKCYFDYIRWVVDHNRNNPSHQIILPNLIRGELQSIISFKRNYMCMQSPCGAGLDIISVNDNGDIYACEEMLEQQAFKIGNIYTASLMSILDKSEVAKNLRSRCVERINKCSMCTWKSFCGGGCTNKSNLAFGSLSRESDYCTYYQKIFEDLIWLLYKYPDAYELICPC